MKYFLGFFISLLISTSAMAQLEVMISGGFQGPYTAMLPEFQKSTGITVTTKSGASQGSGPKTIKAQLATGVTADIVIMSREGLAELVAAGKIIPGTDVDLAQAPLGLAVPAGSPKPDISTTSSFKESLIKAKLIAVPGSTSGIYLTKEVFPQLGLTKQITVTVTERGSQATTLLAAKEVNVAVQPSSELINVDGIIVPTQTGFYRYRQMRAIDNGLGQANHQIDVFQNSGSCAFANYFLYGTAKINIDYVRIYGRHNFR